MKKVALYARVSTDLQQKEGTIESQVSELKRQIVDAGNVLVKEYVDNGYSGAKLDRPALDQMRKDLKNNLFESIYFLNSDRIARDVTYQNIIVTEILKHKKQIIINGKDYVHNPENKFELTVLGAVAELERAKIIERSMRGKQHRIRQGFLLGYGYNIYGYTYIKRARDAEPARLVVREDEAAAVRYIFKAYIEESLSWNNIVRGLERNGFVTKTGKRHWQIYRIKNILSNHTYSGTRYYNTVRHAKESTDPLRKLKYGKKIHRDRSEWIGVKVPAIVSQEIFDKAQQKMDEGKKKYRRAVETQLLSNFIRCGDCGRSFVAYQRYLRHYYKYNGVNVKVTGNVYHKVAYRCNRRVIDRVHLKELGMNICKNPEVSATVIEPCVWRTIGEVITDYDKLQKYLENYQEETLRVRTDLEKQFKKFEQDEQSLKKSRREVLNRYALGEIERGEYEEKSLWFDNEINRLTLERSELIKRIPVLHRSEVIEANVRTFCESAKLEYERCFDIASKRTFLFKYIKEIVYNRRNVQIHGEVPIKYVDASEGETGAQAIPFKIEVVARN